MMRGLKAEISVRFWGSTLDPDDFTRELNLQPTHAHRAGAVRAPGHPAIWQEGMWLLRSGVGESHEIAAQIDALLAALQKHKTMLLTRVRAGVQADIFVGLFPTAEQAGFELPADTIRRLGEFHLGLIVDIYPVATDAAPG